MLKALSLDERQILVRQAVYTLDVWNDNFYVVDIYEDHVIIEDWSLRGYWRADYAIDESQNVTLQPRASWTRVEKDWSPVKSMVSFSPQLKALGEGRIGGYLVLFSDAATPDLAGDFFTKSTNFDIEDGDKVSVYYNHGMDPVLKTRKLGTGTLTVQDAGVWMEAQLSLRDDYEKAIYGMVEAGKCGLSSGTLPNLVERERVGAAYFIKSWPLGKDGSITPTPAEPRTSVLPLKSLLDSQHGLEPEAAPEVRKDGAAAKAQKADIQVIGERNVSENEVKTPPADDGLKGRVDALTESVQSVLKWMEEQPSIKNAGYFSDTGGKSDQHVKSFGDFLKAVQRKDETRLRSVYGSMKAMNEDSGAQGGYLVPPDYSNELLKLSIDQSPALQRVRRFPVNSNTGKIPALDTFSAPTAGVGQTAGAAGLTTAKRAEGGAYTETDADLTQIEWRINDAISGYTKVTKELNADSPQSIEALLRMLISIADAAKQEYYVFQGSGLGEPLGILHANNAAKIGITPATNSVFAYADVLSMKSRFKSYGGSGEWYVHRSMWPDIGSMEVGTAGGAVFQANLGVEVGQRLLGYPIHESEHLAQADASGCVVLADLGAYLLFEKGGLEIDFSEHADFLNGNVVWRFSRRMDGQPWMKGPVTLAGPGSAYTVSPFVYFND